MLRRSGRPDLLQTALGCAAFLVGALLAGLALRSCAPPGTPASGETARVVQVIDGDTIVVEMGGTRYHLRYIGMDTPERGQPYFREATEANRRLVADTEVKLERDVSETDRYGRLLRYVYLADGTMVNAELVRLGFAQALTYPPDVKYAERFRALEREAREAGAGLWAER